jgi:hypothetical protein
MYYRFAADNQDMRKLLLASAVVVSFQSHGGAQDFDSWHSAAQHGLTREPVIGLVPLQDVVGDGCGVEPAVTIPVHKAPTSTSARMGTIFLRVTRAADGSCFFAVLVVRSSTGDQFDDLPTEESGYEIPAAIVYQRSAANWFRIALQNGSGWIHRENAVDFQAYPAMLTHDRLCHLQTDWDGLLWAAPGGGTPKSVPPGWKALIDERISVDVLELRLVGSRRWIRVRLSTGHCAEDRKEPKPVTGWLPVYGRSGSPTVWFYSRGC